MSGPTNTRNPQSSKTPGFTRCRFASHRAPARLPGKWRVAGFFRTRHQRFRCRNATRLNASADSNITRIVAQAMTGAMPGARGLAPPRPDNTPRNSARAAIGATTRQTSISEKPTKKAADKVCGPVSIAFQLVIGVGNHCLVMSKLLLIEHTLFNQVNDFCLDLARPFG